MVKHVFFNFGLPVRCERIDIFCGPKEGPTSWLGILTKPWVAADPILRSVLIVKHWTFHHETLLRAWITTEVICLFLSLWLCGFCWFMLIDITVWFIASWNLFFFHPEDAQSQVTSINIWCLQINSSHFLYLVNTRPMVRIYLSRQNTFLNGSLVFWHSFLFAYHFYGPTYSRPVLSHITSSWNSGKVPYACFHLVVVCESIKRFLSSMLKWI